MPKLTPTEFILIKHEDKKAWSCYGFHNVYKCMHEGSFYTVIKKVIEDLLVY